LFDRGPAHQAIVIRKGQTPGARDGCMTGWHIQCEMDHIVSGTRAAGDGRANKAHVSNAIYSRTFDGRLAVYCRN
jgi:hypothetical protein